MIVVIISDDGKDPIHVLHFGGWFIPSLTDAIAIRTGQQGDCQQEHLALSSLWRVDRALSLNGGRTTER